MVFFKVIVAEEMVTGQFITVGPVVKLVVVAEAMFSIPFCTVPLVKVTVAPLIVSVDPPRSRVPLLRVKLPIDWLVVSWQVLLPGTIVTLSADPGTPLGAQLPAVVQAEEREPFQV